LKDGRGSDGATRDDYEFASLDLLVRTRRSAGTEPSRLKSRAGSILDADCALVIIEKYSDDLGLCENMQIRVGRVVHFLVEITTGCVLTLAVWADCAKPCGCRVVCVEILEIFDSAVAECVQGADELRSRSF
jgi:hypothetical protein